MSKTKRECESILRDKFRGNATGCKETKVDELKKILEECIPGYSYKTKPQACDDFIKEFGDGSLGKKSTSKSTVDLDISTTSLTDLKSTKFTIPKLKDQFLAKTGKTPPGKLKADIAEFIYNYFHGSTPSVISKESVSGKTPVTVPKVIPPKVFPVTVPKVSTPKETQSISDESESEIYTREELEKLGRPNLNKLGKSMGINILGKTKEYVINEILKNQEPVEIEKIVEANNDVESISKIISSLDEEFFNENIDLIDNVDTTINEINDYLGDYLDNSDYKNKTEEIVEFYTVYKNDIDKLRTLNLEKFIRNNHPEKYDELYSISQGNSSVEKVLDKIPSSAINKIVDKLIDKYSQFDIETCDEDGNINIDINTIMESVNEKNNESNNVYDELLPMKINGYSPSLDELIDINIENFEKIHNEREKRIKKHIAENTKKISKEEKKIKGLREKLEREGILMDRLDDNDEIDEKKLEELIGNTCDENNPCPEDKSCFIDNLGMSGYCIDDANITYVSNKDIEVDTIGNNTFIGSSKALDILRDRFIKKTEKKMVPEEIIEYQESNESEEEPGEKITTDDIEEALEQMSTKDTNDELRKNIAKCIGLL